MTRFFSTISPSATSSRTTSWLGWRSWPRAMGGSTTLCGRGGGGVDLSDPPLHGSDIRRLSTVLVELLLPADGGNQLPVPG